MWKKGRFDIKSRIFQFFSRGLSPGQIAMTLSLAFVLGIFPLYGITTALMLVVAGRLRLNMAMMVSTGYLFTPLLFVFWLPFIEFGHWLVFGNSDGFSMMEVERAISKGSLNFVFELSEHILLGILGWVVISPLILGILYFPLLFFLKRLKEIKSFNHLSGGKAKPARD